MKRYIYNLYYLLSLAHSRKKEYEKAIRYINRAIDLKLHFSNAYNIRGLLYCCIHQRHQAIVDFKKAIEINPKNDKPYRNLAKIYGVEQLLYVGEEKGSLTYDEVNDLLPSDVVSSDQIDDIIMLCGAKNIDIIDSDEGENQSE